MMADPEQADDGPLPLTEADKLAAFKRCTRSLPAHYAAEIAVGMTDAQLASALESVLGIFGGCSAYHGCPAIAHCGAGLKIWASWDFPNTHEERPIFAGKATMELARQVYRIANPDDTQLHLF